ncbi:hypothetical protein TVAG_006190 [Trichomonas vaginalis G3]|uniref:Uncharacterized protein n=1 Tax=Trichomonas vaginalis (strain ATCC PRA-98 / G3) TaxID=412133 RepID=A2E726_TRIV3|nr:hypothetical protein TVAGG3_0982710 [Trichomonas vaginalis G3]EAY11544.1 hypothetical protein TVAG_006190 [Trichomonas vaginalis G3]KAI5489428.1 hypothetical protein TVAGG3_0982710 [Trichomonas vaginalis G3]|eukprot:XP_001323767.1 hypothetical protein [Trichomonas vaginalis G3]
MLSTIYTETKQFSEKCGIQQEVKDASISYAEQIVKNLLDPEHNQPVKDFEGIKFTNQSPDQDEFIFVHDFFKTSHLDFPSQILAFESQHPGFKYSRREVCQRFGLNTNDDAPLLVQLIKMRQQYQNLC